MNFLQFITSHWLIFIAYTTIVGFAASLLTLIFIGRRDRIHVGNEIEFWEDYLERTREDYPRFYIGTTEVKKVKNDNH